MNNTYDEQKLRKMIGELDWVNQVSLNIGDVNGDTMYFFIDKDNSVICRSKLLKFSMPIYRGKCYLVTFNEFDSWGRLNKPISVDDLILFSERFDSIDFNELYETFVPEPRSLSSLIDSLRKNREEELELIKALKEIV